jgi:hypothetical protein
LCFFVTKETSAILIKQIRTFSYYYSNLRPIITLFVPAATQKQRTKLAAVKTSLFLKSAAVLLTALALGVFLFAHVRVDAGAPAPPYDLLITNARIVDGSGNPWFRADVAIKDGRIARIGRLGPETASRTIDAQGQILAPGFIDVHTHVESIYSQPAAENFVRMGVTTLVTGNCGSSTTEVGEFLGRIKEKPLAVNLATLIAHGSVRRKVMGLGDRAPTPEELKQMEASSSRE